MEFEPPLAEAFRNLSQTKIESDEERIDICKLKCYELPLVDLGRLNSGHKMHRKECEKEIIDAAKEWGFFQVVNHGISQEMLVKLQEEQVKLFRQPFHKKASQISSNSPMGCYRWGNLYATSRAHFSWSEAFHIPVSSVSEFRTSNLLSSSVVEYTEVVSDLTLKIAEILAKNIGIQNYRTFLADKVVPDSCYLRMNRYPPCPKFYSKACGLVSHTDTSYLTVLHQDKTGGLQLIKDGAWICVKPNPHALVINIGDLFQAWSNGLYKSVRHRVVTNGEVERFSVAYFSCPTTDTVLRSCSQPSIYRDFSFEEYKRQIQIDVKSTDTANYIIANDLQVNDLALRDSAVSQSTISGKFKAPWEGPYKITKIIRPGSFELSTLGGSLIKNSWNARHLKNFFLNMFKPSRREENPKGHYETLP